ncbi:flagellar hook-basal body complex protein FliE [Nitrospinota bacterium]
MAKINPAQIQHLPKILNGATPKPGFFSLDAIPGQVDIDGGEKTKTFSGMLTNLLSTTNDKMVNANQKSTEMLAGESKNIHEVMIAIEKADISFRFLNQVRRKALDAYTEIFRMQL